MLIEKYTAAYSLQQKKKSTQIIFTKTPSFTAKTDKFKNQKQQIQTRFKASSNEKQLQTVILRATSPS